MLGARFSRSRKERHSRTRIWLLGREYQQEEEAGQQHRQGGGGRGDKAAASFRGGRRGVGAQRSSSSTLAAPAGYISCGTFSRIPVGRAFLRDFLARTWVSYRRGMRELIPSDLTSDAGWGCMVRSGQMLLAEAFARHFLGRGWSVADDYRPISDKDLSSGLGESRADGGAISPLSPRPIVRMWQILRWFIDVPCLDSAYGLHNVVRCGLQYGKRPPEWYSPGIVSQVLRDLVNVHRGGVQGSVSSCSSSSSSSSSRAQPPGLRGMVMYVSNDGCVYEDEVHALCCGEKDSEKDSGTKEEGEGEEEERKEEGDAGTFDPLCNLPPPPESAADADARKAPWESGVLIVIPLKLGQDGIIPRFHSSLCRVFRMPQVRA